MSVDTFIKQNGKSKFISRMNDEEDLDDLVYGANKRPRFSSRGYSELYDEKEEKEEKGKKGKK
jgi:hypothetical protein